MTHIISITSAERSAHHLRILSSFKNKSSVIASSPNGALGAFTKATEKLELIILNHNALYAYENILKTHAKQITDMKDVPVIVIGTDITSQERKKYSTIFNIMHVVSSDKNLQQDIQYVLDSQERFSSEPTVQSQFLSNGQKRRTSITEAINSKNCMSI